MKHALSGVEAGRKAGTNPIEIMGLMIGKPDGDSIVVMDACPLPVQGSETRVVADDAQIHMLELMESMELVTNKETLQCKVGQIQMETVRHL